MSSIAQNIRLLQSEIPDTVKLVAVSKFHPASDIMEAYKAGQRIFAESRPQELSKKMAILPKDIQWHFIGHLQSNKVKMVVPYIAMIHSVASERLLYGIDACAAAHHLKCKVLLEVFIAQEETKQGFSACEVEILLDGLRHKPLHNVDICGLMGMATFTDDSAQVRKEFGALHELFVKMRMQHPELTEFKELSMGMTHDYHIALEQGSTMVRIGTKIFGQRV